LCDVLKPFVGVLHVGLLFFLSIFGVKLYFLHNTLHCSNIYSACNYNMDVNNFFSYFNIILVHIWLLKLLFFNPWLTIGIFINELLDVFIH
jgi:hypothetical protein